MCLFGAPMSFTHYVQINKCACSERHFFTHYVEINTVLLRSAHTFYTFSNKQCACSQCQYFFTISSKKQYACSQRPGFPFTHYLYTFTHQKVSQINLKYLSSKQIIKYFHRMISFFHKWFLIGVLFSSKLYIFGLKL